MPSKNVTTLASKKTGNYTVQFMRDDEDYYALAIVYTGDWASACLSGSLTRLPWSLRWMGEHAVPHVIA